MYYTALIVIMNIFPSFFCFLYDSVSMQQDTWLVLQALIIRL